MKENIINFLSNNTLKNRVMVKLWDDDKKKWYFKVIDVKKEEKSAIISYDELLKRNLKSIK